MLNALSRSHRFVVRASTGALPSFIVVALLSIAGVISPASAQERARDYVQPRVTRAQFTRLGQDVGLDSNQRQISAIAFSDYESSMEQLMKRLDEQALTAGRAKVDDSLAGKARVAADELQRLRVEVLKVYSQAGPAVDDALDMLLGGIEVLLTPDQSPKFDKAARDLRREIMLHPRASAASYQEYAGDGVDVITMVAEARGEGGELAPFPPDALDGILAEYETNLDRVLIETYSADRQGRIQRKIASISKDAETLKREEQAALQRWQRLYQLNQNTVKQIAAQAKAAIGDDAATQFTQRFDRESFTWLYPRRKPDRQIEWLRRQETVSPETLAKAEDVYSQYILKRDGLSHSAIEMMLKARIEFQTFLYAMMDHASIDERLRGGLYEELLKNTGEQAHLESSASSQIESLLDEPTRQGLREAMKRPDRAPQRTTAGGR